MARRSEEGAQKYITLSDGRKIVAEDIAQGDTLSIDDLNRLFSERVFGGGSPDQMMGAADYMQKYGLSPQQYQDQTGGLPFKFNPDGTATMDLASRKNTYSYNAPETNWLHKIGPMALGGMAAAGLTGLLPGTTPFWGGAAPAAGGMGGGLTPGNLNFLNNSLAQLGGTMTDAGVGGMGMFGEGAIGAGAEALGGAAGADFASSFAPTLTESTAAAASGGAGLGMPSMSPYLAELGGALPPGLGGTANWLGTGGLVDSGGGFWDKVYQGVKNGLMPQQKGGGQDQQRGQSPGNNLLGALLEWYQSNQNKDQYGQDLEKSQELTDPFAKERPFYQQKLHAAFNDPNFFENDPVWQGMRDNRTQQIERRMAALGYSNSPQNMMSEVGKYLNNDLMQYRNNYIQQLGTYAGGTFPPQGSGQLAANNAGLLNKERQQRNGAIGNVLGEIGGIMGGAATDVTGKGGIGGTVRNVLKGIGDAFEVLP